MAELNDKTIDYLEQFIPELAATATTQAYWQALATGNSVLVSDDGIIKEIFPDGTAKVIAETAPWVKVRKGKIALK